ncbi:MAG: flagellar hook-associated protein FlgL [Pseudomonadota bacterium]
MRISTNTIYDNGTTQIGNLQSGISKTQMQLSTNRRMLTAADDPIASARALEVTQSQSINTQFVTNRGNARSSLSQVELALTGTTTLLQDVQTLTVSAGNGALSGADRESIATELEGRLNDLLGLANTADGGGGYLFSGFRSTTQPFTQTTTGAQYHGDQGQRQLQVGSSRQLPIADSGSSVFEANPTGNGTFETIASPGNTGTGIVTSGAVANAALLNGQNYNYVVTFAVAAGGATTYQVTNTLPVPPVVVAPPAPFTPGQQLSFNGVAFDINGNPANGDTFVVKPSQNQSVFQTMTDLINTLRSPVIGAAGQAKLTNGLNKAADNLNSSLNNVLSVHASVGSRLKELDYLDGAGDDLDIQYATTLSQLQDLDVVKAISLFTQQQFTLESAQKSFKTLTGLSLFNFIT